MRNDTAGATTLDQMRADYDWQEAFGYAGQPDTCAVNYQGGPKVLCAGTDEPAPTFTLDDVAHVEHVAEGENDGPDWLAVGRLKDGRWFFLSAGCDYTGWD